MGFGSPIWARSSGRSLTSTICLRSTPLLESCVGCSRVEGNYVEGEKHFRAALKAAEGFGPEDPRLAASLGGLAEVLRLQGRYAEAEPLYKRALAINEMALGPEHPHSRACQNPLLQAPNPLQAAPKTLVTRNANPPPQNPCIPQPKTTTALTIRGVTIGHGWSDYDSSLRWLGIGP